MGNDRIKTKRLIVAFLLSWLTVSLTFGTETVPAKPSKKDKCPVCGMFVYKYPGWIAEIVFNDGSVFFFDGAKDFFKFYYNLNKYHPHKTHEDIAAKYVTEYYNLKLIKADDAFFVIGSDIYGPMGKELIPFEYEADAEEFMKDHKGKRVLNFKNIKPTMID